MELGIVLVAFDGGGFDALVVRQPGKFFSFLRYRRMVTVIWFLGWVLSGVGWKVHSG